MDFVQVNMSTDDVLAWMQDRCDDRDDALQQISQACQAGEITANAIDTDEDEPTEIGKLEWIDKVPVYSDHHKCWVLAPPDWRPWQNTGRI